MICAIMQRNSDTIITEFVNIPQHAALYRALLRVNRIVFASIWLQSWLRGQPSVRDWASGKAEKACTS